MKLILDCKHSLPKETLFRVVKENSYERYPDTYDEFLTQLIIHKLDYDKAIDLSIRTLNIQWSNIIRQELVRLFRTDDIRVNVGNSSPSYKISVDISYDKPDPKFIADVAYRILRTTMPTKLEPVLGKMVKTYDQMIAENVKYYKCSYKEAKQLTDIIILDRVLPSIIEGCLRRILRVINSGLKIYVQLANPDKLRHKYGRLLQKLKNRPKDQL